MLINKIIEKNVAYACVQDFGLNINGDPEFVEQAMSMADAELSRRAMAQEIKREIKGFKDNDAWELWQILPLWYSSTVGIHLRSEIS